MGTHQRNSFFFQIPGFDLRGHPGNNFAPFARMNVFASMGLRTEQFVIKKHCSKVVLKSKIYIVQFVQG